MPDSNWLQRNARLRAVASLVPAGTRVADIGTDHGRLPALLLRSGRALHCVATELAGRRTRGFEPAADLAGRLEFRRGFGLRVLEIEDRIDVVVLSGLGARSVLRIFENRPPREIGARRLVIQPQTEPALVRRWLHDHGYAIVAEQMARERGRFYVAVAAEPAPAGAGCAHPRLSREDLEAAGPCLVRSGDPVVREYWRRAARAEERILRRVPEGTGRTLALHRLERARRVLAALPGAGRTPGADPGASTRR